MDSSNPQETEVVKLTPPPKATKENIFGYNYGIRPYRKGGVRLERQIYKNKIFYHNYGHGGAGVTLAYGCARHIVEMFLRDASSGSVKEIAIVGCGYMGLMQSILLADSGFKVTIYTKDFPKELGVYDGKPCITSQVAGGLWFPFGIDYQNKALINHIAETTFTYYKECIEKRKYKGISFKPVYMMGVGNPVEEFCPPGLIKTREVKVDFGNGVLHDAIHFTSMMIDGDIFLKELFEEAKSKGVKFEQKSFEDIIDLCELKEKHIFNCTGSYSSVLFSDRNIVPIVGHILYLKKTPGVDYFMSSISRDGTTEVDIYPQSNKLAVGYTYEERGWLDKLDPESIKIVAKNLNEFLEWRVGAKEKPKL